MTEPDRIEIMSWGGGLGIALHSGPKHSARVLRADDWPLVEEFHRAGKLGFRGNDAVRALFEVEFAHRKKT